MRLNRVSQTSHTAGEENAMDAFCEGVMNEEEEFSPMEEVFESNQEDVDLEHDTNLQYDIDKWFDYFIRSRDLHIATFSITGLLLMIVSSSLLWYGSERRCNSVNCYDKPLKYRYDTFYSSSAPPKTRTLIILIQCLLSSTTIITMIFIVQKYQLKLLEKKKEWGAQCTPEQIASLLPHSSSQVYNFLQSTLKWEMLGELLIHVPHPILLVPNPDTNDAFIVTAKILMFLRLYVFIGLFHRFSDVFRHRQEILSSNATLRKLNYQVEVAVSIKMIFYQYSSTVVMVLSATFLFVFGFSIFLVERSNVVPRTSPSFFGTLENSVWFVWVSLSTIGYGDLYPATHIGRITAALCTTLGISLTILLSAAWTNKLAASNEQRHIERTILCTNAEVELRESAAVLIQRVFHEYQERLSLVNSGQEDVIHEVHYGHKENLIYSAIDRFREARRIADRALIKSDDPSLDSNLEVYLELMDRITVEQRQSKLLIETLNAEIAQKLTEIASSFTSS